MMMRKILTAGLSEHHHHITRPEVGNPRHNKKRVILFLVIATALLQMTLSVLTIMINAQGSSGDNNRDSGGTHKQQMGICVVGVKSPCNGNR
jgi:hypothetical protein